MDHYERLGLTRNATPNQIREAFRELAMRHHPDRNPTDRAAAQERFKLISLAYHVLSDPDKRAEYDLSLSGGGPPPVAPEAPTVVVVVGPAERPVRSAIEEAIASGEWIEDFFGDVGMDV